jgi:hypothetical protein
MALELPDLGFRADSPDRKQANALLRKARLTARYEPIVGEARMGFRILPCRASRDEAFSVTASKWGGRPDLPSGVTIAPQLSFLAQINLARLPTRTLARTNMPTGGLLSFFYDLERRPSLYDSPPGGDPPGWRVLWTSSSESVARRDPWPAKQLSPCEMKLRPTLTLPAIESSDYQAALGVAGGDPKHLDEDLRYGELRRALDSETGDTLHRFLGHESPVQRNLQLEAEVFARGENPRAAEAFASLPRSALATSRRFQLLLQIDSCDELDWTWGDGGRLYFLIAEEDLAERRFETALAHWQSH